MESPDRVRAHTPAKINARIDSKTHSRVQNYSYRGSGAITQRINRLEREWDIERWLEANAPALALTGLVLGITRSKRWLALPGIVLPFLLQHAVQGWCPPLALFRRLGIRTRREIERERYALKALRGDFGSTMEAEGAIRAVRI